MELNRRKFCGSVAGIIGLSASALVPDSKVYADTQFMPPSTGYEDIQDNYFVKNQSVNNSFSAKNFEFQISIKPKGLTKNSLVAITAPASPTSQGEIYYAVNYLKKIGCKVEIGNTIKNVKNNIRYFSASDKDRAAELMSFFERQDIDAILCGRGGYGTSRILPLLDYDIIRKNPKPLIGFSDITALILAVYKLSGLICYHGPVASIPFSKITSDSFTSTFRRDDYKKPIVYSNSSSIVIKEGKAKGRLTGGNLSMISTMLGTPYEIDTKDSILFIEEVYEEPYKIDRMLTQLWLAGKLDDCNGIIIGQFKYFDTKKNFWPNYSFTIRQIIEQRFKPFNKPCIVGMPIGHFGDIWTLPIGIMSELNTKNKSLTITETPILF